MIAKELSYRFSHYALLLIVMSALCAFYLYASSSEMRSGVAVAIGIVYMAWGVYSHRGELKTPRLVLEYVAVGSLGAIILAILAQIV